MTTPITNANKDTINKACPALTKSDLGTELQTAQTNLATAEASLSTAGTNITALQAVASTSDEKAGLAANSPTAANAVQTEAELTTHTALADAHHTNANDPTSDEKAAMVGTVGAPAVGNKFSTKDDMDVIRAENTDGRIPCSLKDAIQIGGTWTVTYDSTGHRHIVTRTANAANEKCAIPLRTPGLRSGSKGRKLTGVRVAWSNTAAVEVDCPLDVFESPLPDNGINAHANGSSLLGTPTYDTDHDSAAKRKAIGNHCMEVTFETPAYLDSGEIVMEFEVQDAACGAPGTNIITGVELVYSETLVD